MGLDQLPGGVREFANYFDDLVARLDQSGGWCGVFWQRDPDGMRACLDGREVPPWDVVEALLQDFTAGHGPTVVDSETAHARALHAAALVDYDALPGARDELGDRLDVMLREQRYAVERQGELHRRLGSAATHEEAEAIRLELAWAHDDHERATSRCAELRARITDLDHRTSPASRPLGGAAPPEWPAGQSDPGPTPTGPTPIGPPPSVTSAKQRRKRRGGARFAGMGEEAAPAVLPGGAGLVAPAPAAGARSPRGARYGGIAEEAVPAPPEPVVERVDTHGLREVEQAVTALARLRAEGRSGEAHALLIEIASWPAVRFPPLAAGLQRARLGADWATLLWETASLPADRLVAAADALVAAGREADGQQILRQGVARPAAEIGTAVLALDGEGRHREVRALLDAYVRMRAPEEAARSVDPAPRTLVPLLLEAARGVSDERYWDLLHALRVAGFAT